MARNYAYEGFVPLERSFADIRPDLLVSIVTFVLPSCLVVFSVLMVA